MKKIAIVTGASRGIGKAIATRLASEGYSVIGFYKSTKSNIDGVDMQKVDVGDEISVKDAIAGVVKNYGRVDLVINNAGINLGGKVEGYTREDWDNMLATDLTSVFLMSKFTIPYLKQSDLALIINISSRIGLKEYAEADFVAYSAVKAAVNNFTVALARELESDNIRVNAIIPTPTKTDLFDSVFTPDDEAARRAKGELGAPEDVADLVMKTINDRSMTGQLVFDDRVFL